MLWHDLTAWININHYTTHIVCEYFDGESTVVVHHDKIIVYLIVDSLFFTTKFNT